MKRIIFLLITALGLLSACDNAKDKASSTNTTPAPIPWQRPGAPITAQDASQIRLTGRLDGHSSTVFKTVISANSQRLATIGADGRFIIWNIASGRPVLQADDIQVSNAYFLPDDDTLITYGADEKLRKWSMNSGGQLAEVQGHPQGITTVTLSPDQSQIAVGGVNGTVTFFAVADLAQGGNFTAVNGGFAVQSLYFSPNANVIYVVGGDGSVTGWNTSTNQPIRQLEDEDDAPLGTARSTDGSRLAVVRPERVNIYDLSNGERSSSFDIPPFDQVEKVAFSGDSGWLAIGGNLDSVTIFDANSGRLVIALREHGSSFFDLAFSPAKDLILTGINGGNAFLWNLSQLSAIPSTSDVDQIQIPRAVLQQVNNLNLSSLNWSPDGSYLVLSDRRGAVYVLSLGSE